MYKNMNDYELLYMICEGEEINFEILVNKYKPLIYKIVKDYLKIFKKFGYELEDLMQLGYITLYKTAYKYDFYNSSMFYSYFKKSLNNTIYFTMRTNSTSKKEVLNNAFSYDTFIPNTKIPYIDIIESKDNKCDYSKELIIFKNSMPANLSYIFELFYNGYNKEEISYLLDEDISEINHNISKIKEHAFTYKYLFFI